MATLTRGGVTAAKEMPGDVGGSLGGSRRHPRQRLHRLGSGQCQLHRGAGGFKVVLETELPRISDGLDMRGERNGRVQGILHSWKEEPGS